MDLDKLKTTWKNQPEETNKVSSVDIYKMAHSNSSSVVKWIFIIGILELIFWSGLNLLVPDSYITVYKELDLIGFIKIYSVLHYIVIFLFLVLFYKNYSSISISDSTKKLMSKILKVRKTVKYYVYYNLAGFILIAIVVNIIMFSNTDNIVNITKKMNPDNPIVSVDKLLTVTMISQIAAILIMFLILWLFYKVTYGKLLKKLNKNYKELDSLEHLN